MRVLLVNGSPHKKGGTFTALDEASKTLAELGISTEIFDVDPATRGCTGCGACKKTGECVIKDQVQEFIALARGADGFIFGCPVYFSGMAGSMVSFMNRVFYSGGRYTDAFAFKPAAGVAVARRAGTMPTFDELNRFFLISSMPVVPSTYWSVVFGNADGDAAGDAEGMQTMRNLARNMAWMLRCIDAGRRAGANPPELERGARTNYIR